MTDSRFLAHRRAAGRLAAVVVAVLGFAMVASSCMKLDTELKVKSNDKVDGVMIFGFSESLIKSMGMTKADFFKQMKEDDSSDYPAGSKVEDYAKDGFWGQKVTFKDIAASEFSKKSSSTSSSSSPGDDMKLVKEGGKWKFTGTLDFRASSMNAATGLSGGSSSSKTTINKEEEKKMNDMMKNMQVRIKVTFPGDIIDHDSDGKLDGKKTITWKGKVGKKITMKAIAKTK